MMNIHDLMIYSEENNVAAQARMMASQRHCADCCKYWHSCWFGVPI